jgi:FkbM family methyltransferase
MARPQPNVLVNTDHGMMIVNRHDYALAPDGQTGYGVGFQLLNKGSYDPEEINLVKFLAKDSAQSLDRPITMIDGGANIGVHTIEWAKALGNSGRIVSFEAQEHVFHMLAGNVALNNCYNVKLFNAALGAEEGWLEIPKPDYNNSGSYGSMELKQHAKSENIGQELKHKATVPVMAIDDFEFQHLDFFKLDVEGMEMEVLAGAKDTIDRCKHRMLIEIIKIDRAEISGWLADLDYVAYPFAGNFIAVHKSDSMSDRITSENGVISIS